MCQRFIITQHPKPPSSFLNVLLVLSEKNKTKIGNSHSKYTGGKKNKDGFEVNKRKNVFGMV